MREKLETLPAQSGVYLFKDADGAVIYVGKARVLKDRVRSYFQAGRTSDPLRDALAVDIRDLDLIVTDTEIEALALENNMIKRHRPRYNVLLRDDKNHPWLRLTLTEEYPRLYTVRRVGRDGDAYGGPYIPAKLGRRTAGVVHKVFGIRSCKEVLNGRRPRPCLQYDIGRCLAPCVAEICPPERYRQAAEDAALFLEGRTDEVVRRLRGEMSEAAEQHRFEEAASLRDQLRALERLDTPQKITTTDLDERDVFAAYQHGERAALQVFTVRYGRVTAREGYLLDRVPEPERLLQSAIQQYYDGREVPREVDVPAPIADCELLEEWLSRKRGGPVKIHVPQRGEKKRLLELVEKNARLSFDLEWRHPRQQSEEILRGLRDLLDLETEPRRIECFDISNIQGADIVASMVCFEDGLPKKADYRKFRIRGVGGAPDDFASMREVVGRRYRRLLEEGKELPDLILIDGGQGQLHAAMQALADLGLGHQPIASLAKREELLFVPGREQDPIRLPHSSPVLQLVQRVRDEAHRFAIGYHRKTRSKRTFASALDDIPGVGPERRRKLLSRFGSLRGVKAATIEELRAAVGAATAARVRAHLDRG